MKIGTRSVIYGVHALWFHPWTVWRAWCHLYGKAPNWRECVAIFCHDLNYIGKPDIDGPLGKLHPYGGALLAARIVGLLTGSKFDADTYWLTLLHSRDVAASEGKPVSKLYACDKASIFFDPAPFYLLRARLSGEIVEFKSRAIDNGHLPADTTDREWLNFFREKIRTRPGVAELL